jgi:hypothetical protein
MRCFEIRTSRTDPKSHHRPRLRHAPYIDQAQEYGAHSSYSRSQLSVSPPARTGVLLIRLARRDPFEVETCVGDGGTCD